MKNFGHQVWILVALWLMAAAGCHGNPSSVLDVEPHTSQRMPDYSGECTFAAPRDFVITDTSGIPFTNEITLAGVDTASNTVHLVYTQKSSECSRMVSAYQDVPGASSDSCDMTETVCQDDKILLFVQCPANMQGKATVELYKYSTSYTREANPNAIICEDTDPNTSPEGSCLAAQWTLQIPCDIECIKEISTPAPVTPRPVATPAPTPCPLMENTGSTVCPTNSHIVTVLEEKGPTLPGGGEFLWDITFNGGGNTVSFKVDNPFEDATDIYVEYHKPVGSALGAYDVDCERDLKLPGCSPDADAIEAACIARGNKKFTIVTVYFVSNDSFFTNVASAATVPECCVYYDNDDGDTSWKIVSYTYEIICTC